MLAWAMASAAPRFKGWSGLPSILIGRPSTLVTKSPWATPPISHRRGVLHRHARLAAHRAMGIGRELLLRHTDCSRPGPLTPSPHRVRKIAARLRKRPRGRRAGKRGQAFRLPIPPSGLSLFHRWHVTQSVFVLRGTSPADPALPGTVRFRPMKMGLSLRPSSPYSSPGPRGRKCASGAVGSRGTRPCSGRDRLHRLHLLDRAMALDAAHPGLT